ILDSVGRKRTHHLQVLGRDLQTSLFPSGGLIYPGESIFPAPDQGQLMPVQPKDAVIGFGAEIDVLMVAGAAVRTVKIAAASVRPARLDKALCPWIPPGCFPKPDPTIEIAIPAVFSDP